MYAKNVSKISLVVFSFLVVCVMIGLECLTFNPGNLANAAANENATALTKNPRKRRHLGTIMVVALKENTAAQSDGYTTEQIKKKCHGQRCTLAGAEPALAGAKLMGTIAGIDPTTGNEAGLMGGIVALDPSNGGSGPKN